MVNPSEVEGVASEASLWWVVCVWRGEVKLRGRHTMGARAATGVLWCCCGVCGDCERGHGALRAGCFVATRDARREERRERARRERMTGQHQGVPNAVGVSGAGNCVVSYTRAPLVRSAATGRRRRSVACARACASCACGARVRRFGAWHRRAPTWRQTQRSEHAGPSLAARSFEHFGRRVVGAPPGGAPRRHSTTASPSSRAARPSRRCESSV